MVKMRRSSGEYRRLAIDEDDQRAPKGYVPILVGSGKQMERVLVHTRQFSDPDFAELLDMAATEFGYEQQGILRIPCDVEYFRRVVDGISKTKR